MCLIEQRGHGIDLNGILAGLEPSLGPVGAAPTPLEGGITNRNFRVRLGERDYVLRLHGKDTELLGISREGERLANARAAELGIAPEVAAGFEGGLVTRWLDCEPLSEQQLAARAPELAAALRTFHESGLELPSSFSVPGLLHDYERIIASRGGEPPAEYGQASELAARIAAALPPCRPRPCHNDLLAGNIVRERGSGRAMLVDWEYAGMGDPWFDLGNLSVNNGFGEAADEALLAAYLEREPTPAQRARLTLMRLLSDVREAAWGVMQSHVSELEFDFAGYAERHFARLREAARGGAIEQRLAAVAG